ncbi:putative bifunctional diguanylate cyclase/phosphodiesterase [Aureimonas psammosilenae]|uniref:putative bifunctional diguanylate cyclase/phosphodiesterase n=1 Tax=Aureimonas psammosilenae TaxID=2495496 RepID=UPI001869CD56|nr:phosphodiesterase [Aureimonas psammosilenae]
MRRYVERYWAMLAGATALTACVVTSIVLIGGHAVDGLLETSALQKSDGFERLIERQPETLTTLLTGLTRDPDEESEIRDLALLSGIRTFAIFGSDGKEAYRTRSDQFDWLLRDRAGGMDTKSALAPSVLERRPPFRLLDRLSDGSYVVTSPLTRNGKVIAYVSTTMDLTSERAGFSGAIGQAWLKILGIVLVLGGVPALFYVKRKHKIAEAVERIDFLANHDPMTRLLNRRRMQEQTDRIISTARVTREEVAYCAIDIDGLAEINDSLGQAQGDEMLRVVANRLAATIDKGDLLARIASDDFALLHRRAHKLEELETLAARLHAAVSEPVELKGQIVRPKISIGVSRMPRDGRTQNELIKHAQLALSRHKATRNGDFASFEPIMDEETDRRRQIEGLIRKAIESDGFELAYQPLISGDGRSIRGFEALLRMRDEKDGYISPAEFVPIAEARGYIKEIGSWVIREATRQAALWPDHITVSINLSAVQFREGDLARIVGEALQQARIPGHRIEVEVVESLILDRTDSVMWQLRELKQLGVTIAMDDFGTGYSSLGYLWKFPFDKLKIDRSFMVALDEGQANVGEILETIITMAHRMRMKVTTEGVETRAQADLMRSLGCDLLQGFYFGKPMPAEDAAAEILGRFAERVENLVGPEEQPVPAGSIAKLV